MKTTPDFAPFYAARAELMMNDPIQAEIDLKKAIQIDREEWRYHKLLANHYITRHEYEKALSIAGSYYQTHQQRYIIGMLYAKTLLLNKRYRECDLLLSKLNIIPFEGATEGRELYREAKLMLAIQEMKLKNYKKVLQNINAAKLWPQNLGAGKPYEEDIDIRLEEWMSYLCFIQMKNTIEAEKALQKIIQFVPQIDNTIRNFLPANHLVTAWAMKKKNQTKEASDWLDQQIKKFPENKILVWCKEVFNNNQTTLTNYNDATTRILMHLMDMKEIVKVNQRQE